MSAPKKNLIGSSLALSSGLLYGLLGYFGMSIMNEQISVNTMLFWRFGVATLFLSLILLVTQRKKIKDHPMSIYLKTMLYSGLSFALCSVFYFVSSTYIDTGVAMVLFFTYPAIVILINCVVFRQKFHIRYFYSMITILVGMICIIDLYEATFDLTGILFGLLASFCYALYILFSKKSQLSSISSTWSVCLGATLSCFLFAYLDNSLLLPDEISIWIDILGIAIICTTFPILLLLMSMKYISTEQASLLSVLEPLFVVLFGVILLDERITLTQGIGIAVILSGSLLSMMPQSKTKKQT